MSENSTVQDKPVELTEQQKAQLFIDEYKALCEKYGYRIVVSPAYISRDDGTFSTVLQQSVGKLPQKEVQS